MIELRKIDDFFIDEYIITHRTRLTKPVIGGTDWRFADIVAPSFKEILEIANPQKILEIGFNIGGAALMFLSINPELKYWAVDIVKNEQSVNYLSSRFKGFSFVKINSRSIDPQMFCFASTYDLISIDGDHSKEAVLGDIEKALLFQPKYLLFDDVKHPSHGYIEDIILKDERLEIVKMFEFHQCWQGYSMALCKVKETI